MTSQSTVELKECRKAFEQWHLEKCLYRADPVYLHGNFLGYDGLPDIRWGAWQAAWNRRAPAQVAAGLTDGEITAIWDEVAGNTKHQIIGVTLTAFARAIEAKVQAQGDGVEKDAARYRWLRAQHEYHEELQYDADGFPMCPVPVSAAFTVFMPIADGSLEPVGSIEGELDAAIDAAMQSAPPSDSLGGESV